MHSILAWAPLSSLGSSGSRAVALYFQSGNTCRVETGTAGPILGWYIHICHVLPSNAIGLAIGMPNPKVGMWRITQSYCHEKSWVTMTTSETSISAWSKRQVSMFIGYDHCLEFGRPNMAQHSPNNQPRLLDLVAYIICCSCWLSSSNQLHGLLDETPTKTSVGLGGFPGMGPPLWPHSCLGRRVVSHGFSQRRYQKKRSDH